MYIPWGQHWPSNRAKGHRFQSAIKLNAKFQRAIERRISIQTVKTGASQKSHTLGKSTQKLTATSLAVCSFYFSDKSRFYVDFHDVRRQVSRSNMPIITFLSMIDLEDAR